MAAKATMATLVPIRNMDRAIKFYTKVLGAKLVTRMEGEMKDGFASLTLATHEIWLIAPEKREKRDLAYTAFLVKNIKGFVAGLQKNGVKFQPAQKMGSQTRVEGPIAFEPFGASAFFKDSEGNMFMAWQNSPSM